MGSKGVFVSSVRTTERFHLGKFLELFWTIPVETGE